MSGCPFYLEGPVTDVMRGVLDPTNRKIGNVPNAVPMVRVDCRTIYGGPGNNDIFGFSPVAANNNDVNAGVLKTRGNVTPAQFADLLVGRLSEYYISNPLASRDWVLELVGFDGGSLGDGTPSLQDWRNYRPYGGAQYLGVTASLVIRFYRTEQVMSNNVTPDLMQGYVGVSRIAASTAYPGGTLVFHANNQSAVPGPNNWTSSFNGKVMRVRATGTTDGVITPNSLTQGGIILDDLGANAVPHIFVSGSINAENNGAWRVMAWDYTRTGVRLQRYTAPLDADNLLYMVNEAQGASFISIQKACFNGPFLPACQDSSTLFRAYAQACGVAVAAAMDAANPSDIPSNVSRRPAYITGNIESQPSPKFASLPWINTFPGTTLDDPSQGPWQIALASGEASSRLVDGVNTLQGLVNQVNAALSPAPPITWPSTVLQYQNQPDGSPFSPNYRDVRCFDAIMTRINMAVLDFALVAPFRVGLGMPNVQFCDWAVYPLSGPSGLPTPLYPNGDSVATQVLGEGSPEVSGSPGVPATQYLGFANNRMMAPSMYGGPAGDYRGTLARDINVTRVVGAATYRIFRDSVQIATVDDAGAGVTQPYKDTFPSVGGPWVYTVQAFNGSNVLISSATVVALSVDFSPQWSFDHNWEVQAAALGFPPCTETTGRLRGWWYFGVSLVYTLGAYRDAYPDHEIWPSIDFAGTSVAELPRAVALLTISLAAAYNNGTIDGVWCFMSELEGSGENSADRNARRSAWNDLVLGVQALTLETEGSSMSALDLQIRRRQRTRRIGRGRFAKGMRITRR